MMTEQRLQELQAQHQRGLLHRADTDALIAEVRRLQQQVEAGVSREIAVGCEKDELRRMRDAALAERDAAIQREQESRGVVPSTFTQMKSKLAESEQAWRNACNLASDRLIALTEARRVLREISELLPCDTPCDNHDAAPACPTCGHEEHVYKCAGCMARGALAAVLAQEVQ